MGACSAKSEWSLLSLSLSIYLFLCLSLLSLSPLYTVLPIVHRARLFLRRWGTPIACGASCFMMDISIYIYIDRQIDIHIYREM